MPFAKVGAMPMATSSSSAKAKTTTTTNKPSSSYHGKLSSNKPRGITMEDLKKQTALRLAQEQNNGADPTTLVPSQTQQQPPQPQYSSSSSSSYNRGQHYPRSNDVSPSFGRGGGLMYSQQQQQQYHQPSPPPPNHHRMMYPTNNNHSHHHHHPSSYNNMQYSQQMSPPPPPPPSMVPQQGAYANSYGGGGAYGSNGNNINPEFSEASLQMGQSRYNPYEANQQLAAGNNSKLPHGLTVHELKEMTKARLQAEAAEKDQGNSNSNAPERGVSPLDFEVSSHNASRERAMSRDSTGRNSAVSFQQDQTGSADNSYNNIRPVSHSPSHRYNSNVNRTDTWDSASVASHNSNAFSENNYGSETASVASGSMGISRTRSFTVPTFSSTEVYQDRDVFPGPSSMHASPRMPVFDAAVGGNRRRAVTLSPNTGSILEDRPHHGTLTRDRLNMPSFNGSSAASAAQGRQRGYSPVLEQLGLEGPTVGSNGSDSIIGSSVFGGSFSDYQSTNASSSAEFLRESSSSEARVPAPPGFRGSDPTALAFANDCHTGFSPDPSVQSVQDTFSQTSKNPWDTNERRRLASVENLATDLGSILNLSGSEDQARERANTYTFGSNFPPSLPEHDEEFSGNDGFAAKDGGVGDPFRY